MKRLVKAAVEKVKHGSGGGTPPERLGASAKKRRAVAVLAAAFCAAAFALTAWPTVACADGTYGGLAVAGGTEGADYSYDSSANCVNITSSTPLTITSNGKSTQTCIEVQANANLTINNVVISGGGKAPIGILSPADSKESHMAKSTIDVLRTSGQVVALQPAKSSPRATRRRF